MARRKVYLASLRSSLSEMAAPFLAVCLFSTLSAPAIYALRSETFLDAGRITPSDQLRFHDGGLAADKSPPEWNAGVFVPPSFLSGVPVKKSSPIIYRSGGPTLDAPTNVLQKSVAESSTALRNELKEIVNAQTQAVQNVSNTITQMMDEVSQAAGANMADVVSLVPATTAIASSEVQKGIRYGGLAIATAIQKMASQVTEAAARATNFVLGVVSGKHPKFKSGETMREWGRSTRTVGEGALQTMRRLASSLKQKARKILQTKRQHGDITDEGAKLPSGEVNVDVSSGQIRTFIQHSLQRGAVTLPDLCYLVKGEDCKSAMEELKRNGSLSRFPTTEISFQLPRTKFPSSIHVPTARACWMLAAIKEYMLPKQISFHRLAELTFEDNATQGHKVELSRGIFASGVPPSERADQELRLFSIADPIQKAKPLYIAFVTAVLALVSHMRNSPTKTAVTEATCKQDCSDAVWKIVALALRPLGPWGKPRQAENSEVGRKSVMSYLTALPCKCPRVKQTAAVLLSNFLSAMASQLNEELGELAGGVQA